MLARVECESLLSLAYVTAFWEYHNTSPIISLKKIKNNKEKVNLFYVFDSCLINIEICFAFRHAWAVNKLCNSCSFLAFSQVDTEC